MSSLSLMSWCFGYFCFFTMQIFVNHFWWIYCLEYLRTLSDLIFQFENFSRYSFDSLINTLHMFYFLKFSNFSFLTMKGYWFFYLKFKMHLINYSYLLLFFSKFYHYCPKYEDLWRGCFLNIEQLHACDTPHFSTINSYKIHNFIVYLDFN